MRCARAYAPRQTVVVGYAAGRVLLNRREYGGGRRSGKPKPGTGGVQALIVDRDVDPVVPHVPDGERGLVSKRLLHAKAPLLVIRSVEGSDLVMVGRGPELGS